MIPGDKAAASGKTLNLTHMQHLVLDALLPKENASDSEWEYALKLARQFTNYWQYNTFVLREKLGITIEQSLQFTNKPQLHALRIGATVEQALQFKDMDQIDLLKSGVPIEEILVSEPQAGAAPDEGEQETAGEPDPSDPNQPTQALERILDADIKPPLAGLLLE